MSILQIKCSTSLALSLSLPCPLLVLVHLLSLLLAWCTITYLRWLVLSRWADLLLTVESSWRTIATLAVDTRGRTRGDSRLLPCAGDNLLSQVKVLTEEDDTLVGEVPVIPLPAEGLLYIAARLERLQQLDDVQVGDIGQSVVLGRKEILLGNKDAIYTIEAT
jgi:hypothetical protein